MNNTRFQPSAWQPSAWAQFCARDPDLPARLVVRDPIMTGQDKLWVLRQQQRRWPPARQESAK